MAKDRMERVNELVRTILSEHIHETLDLDDGSLVTITRVITSRDLGHAKILVTIFPDEQKEQIFHTLGTHAKALRHILSQETELQRVPSLHFVIDETEVQATHIESVLDSLQ